MILWSLLIAGVPERYHTAHKLLLSLLEHQSVARIPDVELLFLMDNKRRSVGDKRNDLLALARGEYVSFIDDDDAIATDYVEKIRRVISLTRKSPEAADVICFPQRATLSPHNVIHECSYSLSHWKDREPQARRQLSRIPDGNGGVLPNTLAWSGPPAHTMVWRSEIAKAFRFPDQQFGEDVTWVDACCEKAKREIQIEGTPLYFYRWDEHKTMTRG